MQIFYHPCPACDAIIPDGNSGCSAKTQHLESISKCSDRQDAIEMRQVFQGKGMAMAKTLKLVWFILGGLMILTACTPTSGTVLPATVPPASPQPGVEKTLPTPVSPGQKVISEYLQVEMVQAEITTSFLTEYGSTREPPSGIEFLWIHIGLKNTSTVSQELPAPEHFSVLIGTDEYKPTYGHRKEHPDYLVLTAGMTQGQVVDAWLRFDIPAGLNLTDLTFAFLPESTQVSVGFSSSVAPWGDQPIYLWTCAP
jgi:hypothetical protein